MAFHPRHGLDSANDYMAVLRNYFCLEKKIHGDSNQRPVRSKIVKVLCAMAVYNIDVTNHTEISELFPDISSWESGYIRFGPDTY